VSWLTDIEPALIRLLMDAGEEAGEWLAAKFTGADAPSGSDMAKAIGKRFLEGGLESARIEANNRAALAGLPMQLEALEDAASDVYSAFDPPAHPDVPPLDLPIEWDTPDGKEPK
jgi:hypothetical protein